MTNDNFYRTQGSSLSIFFDAALQYAGLFSGVAAAVAIVNGSGSKPIPFILFGAALYVTGKGLEYAHRSNAIANSFTHLEETLREEFKRNKAQ